MIVYAVDDAGARKRDVARDLLGSEEGGTLVVSTQVLSEFYVVVTRKLSRPLPEADAAQAVEQLATLPTVGVDTELVTAGIALSRERQLSLWDGLIVAAAMTGGCETLISEDFSHGARIGHVLVVNPFR